MKEEDRMSETAPETSGLRERLTEALVAQWHREDPSAPGPGPDAAEAERYEAGHYVAALLPVVAHEVAAAEQRGIEGFVRAYQSGVVAEIERRAEQRGRDEVRARVEGLADAWDDPDPERGDPDKADALRAALAEPAPEEGL